MHDIVQRRPRDSEDTNLILNACKTYLRQAEEFLAGRRNDLPAADLFAQSFGCVIEVRTEGRDRFSLGIPFVAAKIEDRDACGEEREERYFDPWYYAAMLVMLLAGGRFRFDRSKRTQYYYLAYADPIGREGNHALRRIIMNPSPRSDVRQKDRTPDAHYDYRRNGLKQTAKRTVRSVGQKTRSHSRAREDAIIFAVKLFQRQLAEHATDRLPDLSNAEYESLLRRALDMADAMHSRLTAHAGNAIDRPIKHDH